MFFNKVGAVCTVLAFTFLGVSCAGAPKKSVAVSVPSKATEAPEPATPKSPESEEVYGPQPPRPQPTYGPEPVRIRPAVLVFGPGRAKGFAFAGVLRAFHEKKLPVGAVLGVEMGGLMAALYGVTGNINRFEWGLLKLKTDFFEEKTGFFTALRQNSKLKEIFGDVDLASCKIPIKIGLNEPTKSTLVREIVYAAPQFKEPAEVQMLIQEGKGLDIGPVISVSLQDEGDPLTWDTFKASDLTIYPDLKNVNDRDFKRRTEIAFRGEKAVMSKFSEIRRLMGFAD